ncbi:MAG: NADH-quinone oxidoreductase subunit D [candidate division WS1 bacterium]|jgi:NADH-quinone oxidoreductase subunit D|nr:NADH-quinone oxidoreductase subunit D [candidate division WS1 bacterium]
MTWDPTCVTEELVVNMGPQHPSTHGVLRLILRLDGERVLEVRPDIGFLHSSLEKIAERLDYRQYLPYTDRYDYLCAMANELAYVRAVESLLGVEPTPRCQWIRVMMAEMNRIASHLVYYGALGMDTGATTVFLYCFRERERILQLFEDASGQRLLYHYFRIGGLRNDLPPGFCEGLRSFLDEFPRRVAEYDALLTRNRIFRSRTEGVGYLSPEAALSYGVTGPTLRGSGVSYDLRRAAPYYVYPELEFDVPTRPEGDVMARHLVRQEEMLQSVHLLHQCLDRLPPGEINVKVPRKLKPDPGEIYVRIESPRGELGVYLISDGSEKPYRLHWRAPSFHNLQAYPEMCQGAYVADLVAILGSLDIILGDVDR